MASHSTTTSLADQRDALFNGAGVLDRTSLSTRIQHRGADARDLLHRLTTNDLLSMADGEARPTIFCSEKGLVIGVFTVLRRSSDDLLLIVDTADASRLVEAIDRYTIIEDAELRDVSSEFAHFAVAGPDAAAVIGAADIPNATTIRHPWPASMQRTDVIVPAGQRESAIAALETAGAAAVTPEAWDQVRIELGVPAIDSELDERSNPLEARLEELINFEKGCYIGQEVVARLDTYEKLQRRLVGLRCAKLQSPGVDLAAEGRNVGRVTSTADSPEFGPIALAYLRKGHWDPGTILDANGTRATVAALPFV
jgi:folate-binding protein YgfZ